MTDTAPVLGEMTYTREWEAPAALVFQCMTRPEHLTQFWGPVGVSTPLQGITVDLRPGGVFRTVMVNDADGTEFPMDGVFVDVVENERLSWTEAGIEGGMTTTVTFVDLGHGRSRTVAHQTNVPEMFRSPESRAGMESSFDKMAAYMATLS
jgi:uncharacterized protein YndB with AHSA1/START domain